MLEYGDAITIVGTLSAIKGTVIASVMAVNGEHKEHHNAIRL